MEKNSNSEFSQRFKRALGNKTVLITLSMLVVALGVVIGMTVLANRSHGKLPDGTETTGTAESTVTNNQTETRPIYQGSNGDSSNGSSSGSSSASAAFDLPVNGYLFKDHDATMQVYSNTMGDYRVHLGLDISSAADAPVCAAADGTVAQVWNDSLMGTCVALSHKNDTVTVYKNLSKTLADGIEVGATVTKGQQLGNVGDTALIEMADEPHLHFEMTVGGLSVDPMDYFSDDAKQALSQDTVYEDEAGSTTGAK